MLPLIAPPVSSALATPYDHEPSADVTYTFEPNGTTACSLILGFNSSKYELTAGHYDVPDDVPIGKYDIVVTDGRGVFTTFDADGSYDIIEGMDIEGIEGRIKEYHNAKLESGSSIEISSTLKVKLVPKD